MYELIKKKKKHKEFSRIKQASEGNFRKQTYYPAKHNVEESI